MSELPVWWFSGVHLVDTNDELFDTKGEGQESVFTGLSILGNTGFEFTNTSSNNKDGTISLRGTSDHVLDEITVTWSVNNGDVVLKNDCKFMKIQLDIAFYLVGFEFP